MLLKFHVLLQRFVSDCMIRELLENQYNFRRDSSRYANQEISILILKPNFITKQQKEIINFIASNNLELMQEGDFKFDTKSTLALYNDIFRFSDQDVLFGYDWKDQKLEYMISDLSYYYIVRGLNAQSLSGAYKYKMREAYGKLSIPDKKLKSGQFEELAIKNIIHVVDASETEIALRLLLN